MTTRSKQKSIKPEPSKITAIKRNHENRVFLLDGLYIDFSKHIHTLVNLFVILIVYC